MVKAHAGWLGGAGEYSRSLGQRAVRELPSGAVSGDHLPVELDLSSASLRVLGSKPEVVFA
jgi:hypothetical protein